TALSTPLPPYRFLSLSRSSRASFSPDEGPDGTAARPTMPPSKVTATSIVGLPRESMISRALTRSIKVIGLHCSTDCLSLKDCYTLNSLCKRGNHEHPQWKKEKSRSDTARIPTTHLCSMRWPPIRSKP